MKGIVLFFAILVLILLPLVLVGCESPAAQREQARADRIRAEAQAYERERAADVAANAAIASTRQMERDAAHQRTVEMLPFVLAIGGGVLVLVLVLVGSWLAWQTLRVERTKLQSTPCTDLARTDQPPDWGLALAENQRVMWHVIATMQRQRATDWLVPNKSIFETEGERT